MPKLVLQFEGRVLDECAVATAITVGRSPGNTVVIDNPAVSGRHARVVREGEQFFVEDLDSRNGTFVNDQRVTRQALQHGDVVLVGKHRLLFDGLSADAGPAEDDSFVPDMPDLGGTVVLDTEQQRRLLAAVQARVRADAAKNGTHAGAAGSEPEAPPVAVLRVVEGRAERTEYKLDGHTAFIGKSEAALIRLRGWFKPKLAVAIGRLGEGYVATALGGRALVNGRRLDGRRGLEHGDRLSVGGLTLEFRLKG